VTSDPARAEACRPATRAGVDCRRHPVRAARTALIVPTRPSANRATASTAYAVTPRATGRSKPATCLIRAVPVPSLPRARRPCRREPCSSRSCCSQSSADWRWRGAEGEPTETHLHRRSPRHRGAEMPHAETAWNDQGVSGARTPTGFDPTPPALVVGGRFQIGTFASAIPRINALEAVPAATRWLHGLRLKEWQAFQLMDPDYFIVGA